MTFEVENKYPVKDPAEIQQKLAALGAQFEPAQLQVDVYYRHPSRDFAATDEALRIRRTGQKNFITYKGPKIDATTKTRREIELDLPPGDEGYAGFTSLLEAIGFTPVGEVRKQRQRAVFSWQGRRVEASLDEVEGLGTFFELELTAEDEQLDSTRAALSSLAAQLALPGCQRRSYLELLLERRT